MPNGRICHARGAAPDYALAMAWLRGLVAALLVVGALGSPARAQEKVDLLLVLAVDSSGSVNTQEFALQFQGYIEAFRNPQVIEALSNGEHGSIAVCLFIWAGDRRDGVRLIADWHLVNGPESAKAFTDAFLRTPRFMLRDGTSLSNAIAYAIELIEKAPFTAERKVIDVSGDGTNNVGFAPTIARDDAVEKGITINGLAILTDYPDLDAYYGENVVGGPGAFVISAKNFDAFSAAILSKLVREISGLAPDGLGPNRELAADGGR